MRRVLFAAEEDGPKVRQKHRMERGKCRKLIL